MISQQHLLIQVSSPPDNCIFQSWSTPLYVSRRGRRPSRSQLPSIAPTCTICAPPPPSAQSSSSTFARATAVKRAFPICLLSLFLCLTFAATAKHSSSSHPCGSPSSPPTKTATPCPPPASSAHLAADAAGSRYFRCPIARAAAASSAARPAPFCICKQSVFFVGCVSKRRCSRIHAAAASQPSIDSSFCSRFM